MKFQKGQYVYCIDTGSTDVVEDCQVCFGKKSVIVILGNDEHVSTECQGCQGVGKISSREYLSTVVGVNITKSVETYENGIQLSCEYHGTTGLSSDRRFEEKDLYSDRAVADAECEKKNSQRKIEEYERTKRGIKNNVDRIIWTLSMHRRRVTELKKELQHHEQRVLTLKSE